MSTEEHECVLLTLPPDVTRVTASMRLSIEAEFGGWELKRVRRYSDGTRKVLLRRRKPPRAHGDHSESNGRARALDVGSPGYPDPDAAAC